MVRAVQQGSDAALSPVSGSHGRNTRSSTLVAEPVQTLESVEAANKALDDRLRQIGLRVVNVASDGRCHETQYRAPCLDSLPQETAFSASSHTSYLMIPAVTRNYVPPSATT